MITADWSQKSEVQWGLRDTRGTTSPSIPRGAGKNEEEEHSAGKWMDHVEGHFNTEVIISAAQMLPILWLPCCSIGRWCHQSNYQQSEASAGQRRAAGCRSLDPTPTPRCSSSPEQHRTEAHRAECWPPASGSPRIQMRVIYSWGVFPQRLQKKNADFCQITAKFVLICPFNFWKAETMMKRLTPAEYYRH